MRPFLFFHRWSSALKYRKYMTKINYFYACRDKNTLCVPKMVIAKTRKKETSSMLILHWTVNLFLGTNNSLLDYKVFILCSQGQGWWQVALGSVFKMSLQSYWITATSQKKGLILISVIFNALTGI